MKIFAIYTNLRIADRPLWFDDFRTKYDESWDLHLTLIQPRYIDESTLDTLKQTVTDFFAAEELHKIPLYFHNVTTGQDDSGVDIMVQATPNDRLIELQRKLRALLSEYSNFVNSQSEAYEVNFNPHITIGRSLSRKRYDAAKAYLQTGCPLAGTIEEVVLSTVNEMTTDEAKAASNQVVYNLR